MNWTQKIAAQLSRIFGTEVSADASEAELLDVLEAQTPVEEAVQSSETIVGLQDRLAALESRLDALASQEPVAGVTSEDVDAAIQAATQPISEQMQKQVEATTELGSTVTSKLEQMTAEITKVKLAKSTAETHSPTPAPAPEKPKAEKEDNANIKMDLKDFMGGNTQVIPGLNL